MATKRKPTKKAKADGDAGTSFGTPRKRSDGRRRWPLYAALSLAAVVLLVLAAYSWDRWLRYDDARELQGEWQVDGTTRVVVVDDASIRLTDDVAYSYVLDPAAKTIEFTFGNMAGAGRYRFSADRSKLVITEGGSYDAVSTLFEDVGRMWDDLVRSVQGQVPAEPVAGEKTTVLVRVSHDAAAEPRDDPALAGAGAAGFGEDAADATAQGRAPLEESPSDEPPSEGPAAEPPSPAPNPSDDLSASRPSENGDASSNGAPVAAPGALFDVSDA